MSEENQYKNYGLHKDQTVFLRCKVSNIKPNCIVSVQPLGMEFPHFDVNVHRNELQIPKTDSKTVGIDSLFAYILKLVRYPMSQKSKHSTICDIISLMEEEGVDIPEGLVKSVNDGIFGDVESEKIILNYLGRNTKDIIECFENF